MATILKVVVFFVGWVIVASVVSIPGSTPETWRFFAELIPLSVLAAFTIAFLSIEKNRITIPIFGMARHGTLVGIVAGIVWIGISFGVLLLMQQISISETNRVQMLWLWIASAFVNVIMQELLVRGYIYQLLKREFNLAVAVVTTTLLFTLMHGGAIEAGILPVANVVTMSLFVTALYESEKTILAPIAAHSIWNIFGAIILGGVCLADDYPSICTLVPSSNMLLSGGALKVEASIVVLLVNIALPLFFSYRYRKQLASK